MAETVTPAGATATAPGLATVRRKICWCTTTASVRLALVSSSCRAFCETVAMRTSCG